MYVCMCMYFLPVMQSFIAALIQAQTFAVELCWWYVV